MSQAPSGVIGEICLHNIGVVTAQTSQWRSRGTSRWSSPKRDVFWILATL